ncbi:MAG: nucleotidyltransferase family protein [Myxococcota bacterium]
MSAPRARVAALVLAAGRSARFGNSNKLLERLDGKALVARAVDAPLAAGADPVIVVTGFDAEGVRAALASRPVVFAHNPRHALGLGGSIAVGARAAPADVDGIFVGLGDMPFQDPAVHRALVAALRSTPGATIALPARGGRRGHPVLFGAEHRAELATLSGDEGARRVVAAHADRVVEWPVEGEGTFTDVDSREDWRRAASGPPGDGEP